MRSGASASAIDLPDAASATAYPALAASAFDYVGFERRLRGDSDTVLATLADRYDTMPATTDLSSTSGAAAANSSAPSPIAASTRRGSIPAPKMVEEARGHDRAVHLGDGLDYLRSLPAGSLGSVISVHVVEHLVLDQLVELSTSPRVRRHSARKIGPGQTVGRISGFYVVYRCSSGS